MNALALAAPYRPRSIKRHRRTRADMDVIREGLVRLAEECAPATVRHLFYRAVDRGLVEKSEAAYHGIVGRLLTRLRREGLIPHSAIADNIRFVNEVTTYTSAGDALEEMAALYRRNLWHTAGARVEVWCEKDAIASVLMRVTHRLRVPLAILRGYPSETFVFGLAKDIACDFRPTFVFYVGDHDPSGRDIERFVTQRVRELAPNSELTLKRIAVTEAQIKEFDLPTRPTKKTDSRSKGFIGESVEVDAMDPRTLENLLADAIVEHLDLEEVHRLRAIEEQERETLATFAAGWKKKAGR